MQVGDWWRDTDHLRGFWRLYLNEQDGVSLGLGRKTFEMPAGALVLVPAGLEFTIALKRPVQQLFALFEFLGWPPDVAREILPGPEALPRDDLLLALARELCNELGSARDVLEPPASSRLKALVHLSIASVLSRVPADRARRVLRINEGQREMIAVLHYIDEHLAEPMSNARLAEIALSSESRFIRRFREATGRTPARYVQERRLERASELLISTDFSIDKIAEGCGFANRYYFTRVFTQRMGLPPGRYRSERPHLPANSSA
jgi:AraC-like DNA-binding protein